MNTNRALLSNLPKVVAFGIAIASTTIAIQLLRQPEVRACHQSTETTFYCSGCSQVEYPPYYYQTTSGWHERWFLGYMDMCESQGCVPAQAYLYILSDDTCNES
jgi:hypothetical protein